MNDIVMFISVIFSMIILLLILVKKIDVKIPLFVIGIILMYISLVMGNEIDLCDFKSCGFVFLDPIMAVIEQFKTILSSTGFLIIIFGGYSMYITSIKANDVTVYTFTKLMRKVRSVYILVPIVFLIGHFLSLVIPSASNLAVIMLATFYPVLKRCGMSSLTASAIIATSATIIPSPFGGDNIAVVTELSKYPQFSELTVKDYLWNYHSIISIPTIVFMAVVHFFWQKFMDRNGIKIREQKRQVKIDDDIRGGFLYKFVYTFLPFLPIILWIVVMIVRYVFRIDFNVSIEAITIISFIIVVACEIIRTKKLKWTLKKAEDFFRGMGSAISIVSLLVAASVFILGLKSIGLVDALEKLIMSLEECRFIFIPQLIFVLIIMLIVFLSGSGTAMFYELIPSLVPFSLITGSNVISLSIIMAFTGHLMRAVSPVSAVVIIVAATTKEIPIDIIKRTSVPMILGIIFIFILTTMVYGF